MITISFEYDVLKLLIYFRRTLYLIINHISSIEFPSRNLDKNNINIRGFKPLIGQCEFIKM